METSKHLSKSLSHTERCLSRNLNVSDCSDVSDDDDGSERVASPFQAYLSEVSSTSISSSLPPTPGHELSAISTSEMCLDAVSNSGPLPPTLSSALNERNPFQRLLSPPNSPPVSVPPTDLSPVDPLAFFGYESNRLDSFKKLNCPTFAERPMGEVANAGFYLMADGTTVQCPWCKVELTEAAFDKILQQRPKIPRSPLNDEPWTAMRVHRHANGQKTNEVNSWCPFVRREWIGLEPNIPMVNDLFPCSRALSAIRVTFS